MTFHGCIQSWLDRCVPSNSLSVIKANALTSSHCVERFCFVIFEICVWLSFSVDIKRIAIFILSFEGNHRSSYLFINNLMICPKIDMERDTNVFVVCFFVF